MLLDLCRNDLFLQTCQQCFASSIVKPTVTGASSHARSIVATSCSTGLPETTSATTFTVHFMSRD
jgi:hypothetical protein